MSNWKRACRLVVIVFAVSLSTAASSAAIDVGDRGAIDVPVQNFGATNRIFTGLTLAISGMPAWANLLPASSLGPLTLAAGASSFFEIEFLYNSSMAASDGSADVLLTMTTPDGPYASCHLSTRDFFATSAYLCKDASNHTLANQTVPDYVPPTTSVQYLIAPYVAADGTPFLSASSQITLNAVDVVLASVTTSGVASTFYGIDSPAGILYSAPFALNEGRHTISFYSVDFASNSESPNSLSMSVDGTPPQTSATIAGYSGSSIPMNTSWPSGAAVYFSALDPVSNGVSAGVSRTLVQLDGGAVQVSSSPIVPSDGFHQITYFSIDNAENAEPPHMLTGFWGVPADTQPPTTSPFFSGTAVTQPGTIILTPGTSIQFVAQDYPIGSGVGISSTYYLADVSTATCANGVQATFPNPAFQPGTCENPLYRGPILPSPGAHIIYYWSIDRAGNVESIETLSFTVTSTANGSGGSGGGGNRPGGGTGISSDSSGRLWAVIYDSASVTLAHSDQSAVLIASAPLAGADSSFPWSVVFDAAGSAYAVGSALAMNGADQVGVYKASPMGDAIVASQMFDSGFNNNNLVFAASPSGWIVGAVQTSGPIDNSAQGSRTYSLALWKFNPAQGLIQLTTTYSRAGMDVATGIGVDPSGNLWLAGYSYSPNPRSTRAFDLAVWEYAPDGQTLLAGPFIREGYLGDFNTQDVARILVSSGVVYVAAPRGRGVGGTDSAFVSFNAASGRVISENAWRTGDGANTFPSALLQDTSSHQLVVGSFDYGNAGTFAGLWRYGADGGLLSASQANAGGAQGAAYSGSNLWLSVDASSSPYLVTGETSIAGVLSDIQPPRTSLAAGTPSYQGAALFVASTTLLGFTAVDDKLASLDGLGVGVAQTLYAVDGGTFNAISSSFTLVAEGTHTVSFYSLDQEGNAEVVRSTQVGVDLTAPTASLVALSSSTFAISAQDPVVRGAASGVAFIQYLVDASPDSCNGNQSPSAPAGTCANLHYGGAFSLSAGTHTVYYQAVDNVGNGMNVVNSSYVVVNGDVRPPRTALVVGTPTYASTPTYISPATPLGFTAVDDKLVVGDGVGLGVARTLYAVDTASFTVYSGTFAIPAEGAHVLRYYSVDVVGNVEAVQASTLAVDATPPSVAFQVFGTSFTDTSGSLDVSTSTAFGLLSADPLSNGVASGVKGTQYEVGGGSFTVYAGTFSLAAPDGPRLIAYQAMDNVGNVSLLKATTVFLDATPPVTALSVGAPQYASSSVVYVSTLTPFSLASADPVVGGVASGVKIISVAQNGGAYAAYAGTFTLAAPDGAKSLSWFAADNVGNTEIAKSSAVVLDATPPQTTFGLLGGRQSQGPGGYYSSPDARFLFASTDPAINGSASGVAWTRWQDGGGAFTVYAASFTLPEGAHALGFQSQDNVGNLEVLRSTTVLIDATPPVTTVSVGAPAYTAADGTLYVATTTLVSFAAIDPALSSSTVAGSGVDHIEVAVDSAAWTPYATALAFAEGAHTVLYRAVDNVGNVENAHTLALRSDGTPPVSSLLIGTPQFALSSTTVLVSSLTPLGISAVDPVSSGVASGVRQSFYSVGGGTFAVFAASFTLAPPDGPQVLSFYSQDDVLNTESVKVSTVVLDSTPPEIALLSPGGCNSGICRVVKGKFPVLGTARDLHFASYVLDFAPGQNAATGYALISSGTVAVSSGALGTWDASTLAGWQTLRLTAIDLVANTSALAINIFVGDPGELMALGNHDVFDMPQGVAADAQGNVYVADTNADRVAVYSATGTFLAAFGKRGDDDDGARSAGVRLSKPRGVAVDAAGNIYVADTDDNRVLKLSATGQILLAVGRREKRDKDDGLRAEFAPGRKPGQFDKPSGLTLDAAGNIYIADTDNGRVQKLGPDGAPLLAFALPPVPSRPGEDKDGDKDDRPATGRPFGIALDAAGNIYVADPAGGRALEFSATGQLLLTLPIRRKNTDGKLVWGRPFGVAVSTDGFCLLVSDQRFDRVLKFDGLGDQTLVFGAPPRRDEGRKPSAGIFLRKPMGLALAPDGTLLVADRNDSRILRLGLPTGAPTLVVPPPGPDRDDRAREVLDKDSGGRVVRRDGAAVHVPVGALSDDLKITVSTMSQASAVQAGAMDQKASDKGLKPAYAPVEYGPEGTQFATPVQLVVPYNPQLVALQGLSEDSLKVHYWNKAHADWEALESVVDKAAHTVSAKTPHFSLYQVLGSTDGTAGIAVAAADASFGLKAAYAFPNPVHAGGVTVRIQPGLADSVSVRIYDISGRKVHESSDFSLNPALDDGNGLGAQYTYDHVWDISGVGSGVYTYVITAKHAGNADVHKTGRVGVSK